MSLAFPALAGRLFTTSTTGEAQEYKSVYFIFNYILNLLVQCLAHIQVSIIIVKETQRRRGVDRQKSRGKITWFAETSLVVQWWSLHLPMQGVLVRAKIVAHASKPNKQTKKKWKKQNKTKHKQQDIVTNSVKTLEMVHVKKKKIWKENDFLFRVPHHRVSAS